MGNGVLSDIRSKSLLLLVGGLLLFYMSGKLGYSIWSSSLIFQSICDVNSRQSADYVPLDGFRGDAQLHHQATYSAPGSKSTHGRSGDGHFFVSESKRDGLAEAVSKGVLHATAFDKPTWLRIYVYDVPTNFTTDLNCNKDFRKSLHDREEDGSLMSDWMAMYQLDKILHEYLLASKYRTLDPEEADVFFVPFYASCGTGWGLGPEAFAELLRFVNQYPYWERYQGRDHLFAAAGLPGSDGFKWSSEDTPLWDLGPMVFGVEPVLHDYNPAILLDRYLAWHRHMPAPWTSDLVFSEVYLLGNTPPANRAALAFWQASLNVWGGDHAEVRHMIARAMRKRSDCVFLEITSRTSVDLTSIVEHMPHSKFCIVPSGDTRSSKRVLDSLTFGCIPVFFDDLLLLPFEDVIDWEKMAVWIPHLKTDEDAEQALELLASISAEEIHERWKATRAVAPLLQFDDAVVGNAFEQVLRQLSVRSLSMRQWARIYKKSTSATLDNR